MKIFIPVIWVSLLLYSCQKEVDVGDISEPTTQQFISGVDISSYPEIMETAPSFYDSNGDPVNFLTELKNNGVNSVRLRLWVNPINEHSGFNEVKTFANQLRSMGFKIWLTLHYSDTWADPGNQITPAAWPTHNFEKLTDSVYAYTFKVVSEIHPDYIQVGNEINNGFLHPSGDITQYPNQFITLMQTAIAAVRTGSNAAQIIVHYAGTNGAEWFFDQLNSLDYDIIGLSYYPIWHGKSLNNLSSTLQTLSLTHGKNVLICETAYPFTLNWNDWTTNIIGSDEQIIAEEYPASPKGQTDYIKDIKALTLNLDNGVGFCYWGGELIAWKGSQSTDGSSWENQALFDFNNQALPVLKELEVIANSP